jgi:hypothetical protein
MMEIWQDGVEFRFTEFGVPGPGDWIMSVDGLIYYADVIFLRPVAIEAEV